MSDDRDYHFGGFKHDFALPDQDMQSMWDCLLREYLTTDNDSLWVALSMIKELDNRGRAGDAWHKGLVEDLVKLITPNPPTGPIDLGGDLYD